MHSKLILLRHGQSEWNLRNLFTGWVDIPLSAQGIEESIGAGKKIAHLPIDVIFVSSLIRAQMTAMLAMAYHSSGKVPMVLHSGEKKLETWAKIYSEKAIEECIPVIKAPELNERMYGRLQGMNKQEMREKYGEAQVERWRRSFHEAPPEGESLAMTAKRTLPYFQEKILPFLHAGSHVLISAHGNSLRSILMHIERLSEEEVVHLELMTGEPIVYQFSKEGWSRENG